MEEISSGIPNGSGQSDQLYNVCKIPSCLRDHTYYIALESIYLQPTLDADSENNTTRSLLQTENSISTFEPKQMPVSMPLHKAPFKSKQLKAQLSKELLFLKNVFSVLTLPSQMGDKEDNADYEMSSTPQNGEEKQLPPRARSIAELEQKLEKIKSQNQNKFNLKNKLVKKSLSSKLNKKLKKKERQKSRVKPSVDTETKKIPTPEKAEVKPAKPVFNTDGKLVFSKFDFSNVGRGDKPRKGLKDPKKILENLKQEEQKFRELEQQDENKVKEIKEKMAWKSILQKAEGQKLKDDPILLKKSIKKMEQKKKQSKKQWENRIKNVEQKKDVRQKKRSENLLKKKKEKKTKIVKAAVKRGRVVI